MSSGFRFFHRLFRSASWALGVGFVSAHGQLFSEVWPVVDFCVGFYLLRKRSFCDGAWEPVHLSSKASEGVVLLELGLSVEMAWLNSEQSYLNWAETHGKWEWCEPLYRQFSVSRPVIQLLKWHFKVTKGAGLPEGHNCQQCQKWLAAACLNMRSRSTAVYPGKITRPQCIHPGTIQMSLPEDLPFFLAMVLM